MEFGPVQLLVVGSRTASSRARYWPSYDASGSTTSSGWSTFYSSLRMRTAKSRRSNRDLSKDESEAFGGLAGALLGMGAAGEEGAEAGAALGAMTLDERGSVIDPDDLWYMADAIPTGTSAGIALLEHRWAIPLRDAIERAGGKTLVDSWIHPQDLVAAGAEASRKS